MHVVTPHPLHTRHRHGLGAAQVLYFLCTGLSLFRIDAQEDHLEDEDEEARLREWKGVPPATLAKVFRNDKRGALEESELKPVWWRLQREREPVADCAPPRGRALSRDVALGLCLFAAVQTPGARATSSRGVCSRCLRSGRRTWCKC